MSNDIRELRTYARSIWIALTMMFGHPEQVMRHGFMKPSVHRALSLWLRHLEHLVRRILLALALAIFSPPYEPRTAQPASRVRRRARFGRTPCFKVLLPGPWFDLPRRKRYRFFKPVTPLVLRSAGVARRFEALRHAIMHPETHAQRLSRTIMRRIANKTLIPPRVRLKPWRVPSRRWSLPSMAVESEILRIEGLLPDIFVDPG